MKSGVVLIFLLLSYFGYFNWLVNKHAISLFVAPAVIIAGISAAMYLAGLINVMPLCVNMILLFGVLLLIKYRNAIAFSWCRKNLFPICLSLLLVGYLLYYTVSGVYEDGDTMTHWGRIVRSIWENKRLPNFTNLEISYQSYPAAAACWIYFVHQALGYFSEAKALFAQGFWMLTGVISLFALNNSRNRIGDILIFLSAAYFLQGLGGLLVDVLLSLVVISAFVVVTTIKDEHKMIAVLTPFLIIIPQVKNSGLLFAYMIAALALYVISKGSKSKRNIAVVLLLPLVSWYLWKAHIEMVYYAANQSRHAFSVQYMAGILESRSIADWQLILIGFLKKWFSWNDEWQAILQVFSVGLLALVNGGNRKEIGKIFAVSTGFYLIYKIGLLGMYCANMSGDDALKIAGYERYQQTFTMVLICVVLFIYFRYITDSSNGEKNRNWRCIATLILLSGLLIFGTKNKAPLRPDYVSGGTHRRLHAMQQTLSCFESGDKILVVHPYEFTIAFVAYSMNNYQCGSTFSLDDIEEAMTTNVNDYKWLIILEENEEIRNMLREKGIHEGETAVRLTMSFEQKLQ